MIDPTQKQPTLQDVADRAGVSTATVSRCLNAPDRVIQKTRDRVLAAVTDLGYSPNFGARLMAAKRSNTIGAIIPTMENAVFAQGLQAFQDGLHAAGFTLLVACSNYDPKVEADQIRNLVGRGADGLLLIGHDRDPDVIAFLKKQNIPVLIAWAFRDGPTPSIGFDNRAAMKALAQKVLDNGHQRLGYISADVTLNDRARSRLAGLQDALHAAGLPETALTTTFTSYGLDQGAQALRDMMQSSTPPTAVLCGNDVLAAGALQGAMRMGLSVPKDLSITGFDNIDLARAVYPGLTTVQVPHADMGAKAAQALVDQVVLGTEMTPANLPTSIITRETLGPAPV